MLNPLILLLLLTSLSAPLAARDRPFLDEPDPNERNDLVFEDKSLVEDELQLPPLPDNDQLVEFHIEAPRSPFRYFIDRNSLKVGKDGITRMTLLIRSRLGASNFTYEGYQCGESRYKLYAYNVQGELKPLKKPEWKHISSRDYEKFRYQLYRNYLCDGIKGTPLPPEQVLDNIAHNQGQADETSPFLE